MLPIERLFRRRNKTKGPDSFFRSDHYTRHNARRLEHLASLGLEVAGKTVLELGAGIGDHSHYYLDRNCAITITEARDENIAYLNKRYPEQEIVRLDLEKPDYAPARQFQIIHCYGVLYHLVDPSGAIAFMARLNSEMLLLETCLSFGSEEEVHVVAEDEKVPTQSFSGKGCRPTRPWLFHELRKHYEHVYVPLTQPNYGDFPIDWTRPQDHRGLFARGVFIASRQPLISPLLSDRLVDQQTRHR